MDGMRDASGRMYMRNRYYDPATGQFTQTDPIGVAGGLNGYGFADGDPVSYSDPYGLCKRPKGSGLGICVETFIAARWVLGVPAGDGRGFTSDGGSFKTSVRFSLDVRTGQISGLEREVGSTFGIPGSGMQFVGPVQTNGGGGWSVDVWGWGRSKAMPVHIDYSFRIDVSGSGDVSVSGIHDGFPSYEVWTYNGDNATNQYRYEEGYVGELLGNSDVEVKNGKGKNR